MIEGKYQAYPEYKDSGVEWLGRVPIEWKVVRQKQVFSLLSGYAFKSEFFSKEKDGFPILVTPGSFHQDGGLYFGEKNTHYFTGKFPPEYLLNKGDLLIVMTDLSYKKLILGNCEVVEQGNVLLNQRVGKLLFRNNSNEKLSVRYLRYSINSKGSREQVILSSTGATVFHSSPEKIGNVLIALPPSEDQEKIANFLDHETAKIDTLIEKQQQLIKLLKEKRQAVISHAVTKGLNPDAPMRDSGVEWLGEVPEHWRLPKLLHRTSRIGDGLHSTPSYQDNTGYYFVNGNNLINGAVSIGATAKEVPEKEYKNHYVYLDKSSVLLSINGTVGNVARYNNEKIILGKSAAYMNCSGDLIPEYLMLYLQTSQVLRYFDLEVTGTTIFNLSLNSIRQMKVCIPPETEQTEIDEYCHLQKSKYDVLIDKANSAIKLMLERRTALISSAVTGKIDVRDWKVPEPLSIETKEAVA